MRKPILFLTLLCAWLTGLARQQPGLALQQQPVLSLQEPSGQTVSQPAAPRSAIPLVETTISGIHKALQKKACTCEGIVSEYLRRIAVYDQSTRLNSIILTNPQALTAARGLDAEYARTGVLRPLHCIPMIIKDNYNTAGLQTTAGSLALKGFAPATDATMVRRLKDAGAIVLAKSNMAEWAFSPMVTISSIAGETRNPYNLDHVPAGSSGGTAAAVAANLGEAGLGTDTGNSIRGPSSHNALVGFRPTIGLVSREGIAPLYLRNDMGGPMARTVEDAARLLQVVAGYDPADPITKYSNGKIPPDYTRLPHLPAGHRPLSRFFGRRRPGEGFAAGGGFGQVCAIHRTKPPVPARQGRNDGYGRPSL
jgi:Asp-tRNA(Asn)/Glu-tRNA(Gln) amidotransferase A subunit family amidase